MMEGEGVMKNKTENNKTDKLQSNNFRNIINNISISDVMNSNSVNVVKSEDLPKRKVNSIKNETKYVLDKIELKKDSIISGNNVFGVGKVTKIK